MPVSNAGAEVRFAKMGPGGKPFAEILVDKDVSAVALGGVIQRITRDKDLLRKVGLKACNACKSGLDIFIRDRFINEIRVDILAGGRR